MEKSYAKNQGRQCQTPGCCYKARIKGYCLNCYQKARLRDPFKNGLNAQISFSMPISYFTERKKL